jgi:hypothetical protein
MIAKRKRTFTARLEGLESRECLSHVVTTPHHVFLPLKAIGSAQVTSLTPVVGGFVTTGAASGVVAGIGNVTATAAGFLSPNLLNATGTAVITDAAGEQLDVTVSGIFHAPPAGSTLTTGFFRFVVTGGTGRFAHAVGSGSIVAHANFATLSMTFVATGTVIE